MANRTYQYLVTWCWKDEGNRATNSEVSVVSATTVPRAIRKLVRELDADDKKYEGTGVRSSDLLVIDVRCDKLDSEVAARRPKA